MSEEWRTIDGHGGAYEVSNLGRVRSWKTPRGLYVSREPRYLKPKALSTKGYRYVSLSQGGKAETRYVHRLVAFAFLGEPPRSGMHVCHYDGDPSNNDVSNLRWGTVAENAGDRKRHGTLIRGQASNLAKLTTDDVREIRRLCESGGWTYRQIGERFDLGKNHVYRIASRQRWSWLDADDVSEAA